MICGILGYLSFSSKTKWERIHCPSMILYPCETNLLQFAQCQRIHSLLFFKMCAVFTWENNSRPLLLERKRCPNFEEIILLVIYEWAYKMSWKLFDGCRPMHQCQVQKGKERSQPAASCLNTFSFLSPRLTFQFRPCALLAVYFLSVGAGLNRAWSCHAVIINSRKEPSRTLIMEFSRTWPTAPSASFLTLLMTNSGNFFASSSSTRKNRWSMTIDVKRKLFLKIFCHSGKEFVEREKDAS